MTYLEALPYFGVPVNVLTAGTVRRGYGQIIRRLSDGQDIWLVEIVFPCGEKILVSDSSKLKPVPWVEGCPYGQVNASPYIHRNIKSLN